MSTPSRHYCAQYMLALLLTLSAVSRIVGASLSDFGHRNMRVNGKGAIGNQPLLVILASFEGGPAFNQPRSFYDNFVFGFSPSPKVNGYFREVSQSRFAWSRGATIGPLAFPAADRWANFHPEISGSLRSQLHRSNAVHKAMVSGLFDFGAYDANGNGEVTQDELQIVIIDNSGEGGNTVRSAGRVRPSGFSYSWRGAIAWVSQDTGLETVCHELSHLLGTLDLYGVWRQESLSCGLTLMSCTGGTLTKHLDPWHKMQLGWCEPRIRSLRTGGLEAIPAAQIGDPTAPLILYDSQASTTEFFMIEYRTRTSPVGAGYEGDVSGNGLAVWRIRQNSDHTPKVVPAVGISGSNYVVWNEGPPDFPRGAGGVWGSDATTPYLTWLDGSQTTLTRLHVRPFDEGDGSIAIEWLTEKDIWVDFQYVGRVETGDFIFPFDTLAEGLGAVPYGGALIIKSGSSTATGSISKRMTILSYGGPVTVGR